MMAGIYGPIREHPELPETDPGRFTVTIYRHAFAEATGWPYERPCYRCGYPKRHPLHAEPWHVEYPGMCSMGSGAGPGEPCDCCEPSPCPCGQCGQ